MDNNKYGAPVLYFHFFTSGGLPASLPMFRQKTNLLPQATLKGVPDGAGYSCPGCKKTFYAKDVAGLKHGCMNNGGVVHGVA